MNFTKSDANITHPGTLQRMHQSSAPVTTAVTDQDMNMVIWSLMEIVKAGGLAGVDFDPDEPATYRRLLDALNASFVRGDVGKTLRLVSMVVRNDGSGWARLEDADHTSVGGGAISVTVLGRVRTAFSFSAGKVVALLGTNDETFSKKGLLLGASVGVDYADWQLSMPFACWVDKVAGAFQLENIDSWFGPGTDTTVTTSVDQSSFTINHREASEDLAPMCTVLREGGDLPVPGIECRISYGADSITGTCYDEFSGTIYFDGTSWVVETANVQKPTVVFAAGVVTVTHQPLGADTKGLQIDPVSGVYHAYAGTALGSSSFTVAFYTYAGVNVAVANTDMKFRYSRPRKVISKAPDGMRVAVSRGPVALHADRVVSEFGNFWIAGLMLSTGV